VTAAVTHSPTLALALMVALAGAVGAVARAWLIHHIARRHGDPLPIGTIVVNVTGSLVLGTLTGLSLYHGLGPRVLTVLGLGLCGGYTTWSTASWETLHLVRSGHRRRAVVYTFGGLIACLGGGIGGLALAALI
jgi:CrcB protein